MRYSEIKSCFMGPTISPEQFISEHFFLYVAKGKMNGYDGSKHYVLAPGQCCIVRKNQLARYNKQKENGEFEKVIIVFDEAFLKNFQKKYNVTQQSYSNNHAFIRLQSDELIHGFLLSLEPYYDSGGKIPDAFSQLKREELLLILLKQQPELSNILFDFGIPGKIDLESFIQKNYKFNVSTERFAFLTGRSLSAFKRDFKQVFHETPNRWLIKRRLQEAHFLLEKKKQKAADIYLDLGFEDLTHFYFAFKKEFGKTPAEIAHVE